MATKNQLFVHIDPQKLSEIPRQHEFLNKLNNDYIYTLYQDQSDPNIIYLGTYGSGLYILDKRKVNPFGPITDINGTMAEVRILDMIQDPLDSNLIWVCTSEQGLKTYNKENSIFQNVYTTQDGLPANTVL